MKLLLFSVMAILLQGCGSDSKSSIDSEILDAEILLEGNAQPRSSNYGKKLVILNNNEDLSAVWDEYTTDLLPDIDFSNNVVVYYFGGEVNLNECVKKLQLDNITSFTDDHGVINIELSNTLNCVEPDLICTDDFISAHPFKIVNIHAENKVGVVIIENYIEDECN